MIEVNFTLIAPLLAIFLPWFLADLIGLKQKMLLKMVFVCFRDYKCTSIFSVWLEFSYLVRMALCRVYLHFFSLVEV